MRWFIFSIFALYLQQCDGQNIAPQRLTDLPAVLNESSGLVVRDGNRFWSINDSGGEPVVYGFDAQGQLTDSVRLPGITNIDWETLTFDRTNQRLFVGDVGNNSQARQDLAIYFMDWNGDTLAGPVHTLRFAYPDQQQFPATDNFDCEGMVYAGDSLYLFSKNRQLGSKGFTKLYRLPVDTGFHVATLIDSFLTQFPITGASLAPDGTQIALLSYGSLFLLRDYSSRQFHQGTLTRLGIPFSQTEAIDFWGTDSLYFTDEQGGLYLWPIDVNPMGNTNASTASYRVYPNPAQTQVQISGPGVDGPTMVQVIDAAGRRRYKAKIKSWPTTIDVADWPAGSYFVQVEQQHRTITIPMQIL